MGMLSSIYHERHGGREKGGRHRSAKPRIRWEESRRNEAEEMQAAQGILNSMGKEKLYLAKEMWSVVIGAKGARIRGIEKDTGAKLQLIEEGNTSFLQISGTNSQRREALKIVRSHLDRQEQELLPIPVKFHGLIIGKRGSVVREIQRESGAVVNLVRLPEPGLRGQSHRHHSPHDSRAACEAAIARLESSGNMWEESLEDQLMEEYIPTQVWEEATAIAFQRAKDKYQEERLERARLERGIIF
ncbi:hypothetical protein GUITHDRAFT_112752 [Guillardia theta CCMP2712]|uniref:K Homology domain-containing protein n=1 Tax=Guillardia theta (strain CCMP2712) TaxID=905079 RepID=L1IYJ7_GUITC|nr:hypothetical protein GUITHDRAFT_112752 [Guillardia theta CCMP2712]EKX41291.1 hypothetical protein GUITHDRAFT_112752 [Guillardia theta CCMP2712]|eukprot:XP_005828271.1 hypothetical protein GUITHDRAFT_112752 [Guillardia theta CCMP2712]